MKFFVAGVLLLAVLAYWLWTPDRDLAWLEARYLDAPGDMMDVAGTRLHVRDSGAKDAPALVMLHGFGSSLHTWEPWAQALSDRHRVIRLDLPGSGLSPPDATGDYSDARSMQLVAALMDRLGVAQATLVGNSLGGRIAWRFAAQHPDRVRSLVLVSPDGFASPGFEYDKSPEVPAMLTLMRYCLPRFLLKMSLEPAYADKRVLTEAMTSRYHDLMRAPGARDAILRRMEQVMLTDPVPLLRQIKAPVLLLWGEQDAMIPFSNAADYVAALPDARLVPLPGMGHVPHEEDPARSLAPLRAFLE